ncbi:MAG: F0F1 ATP synthase subunit B [Candidatus Moraniibacteriota bacterium]|nr:MAG: F0F1 ATP synthase subunit B [Candidatus Moranbacteria bacterium]
MDVLSKLGIDWKLLVAQVINFLVLLWVLRKFAYRPMLEFLEKRAKHIESGLRDAKRATEKLSEIEAKEREVLEEARKESAAIVARARESAEKIADKVMAESREESERILVETRKKLEAERESVRVEMKRELVGLVLLATEKVLAEKLNRADDEVLIRKAVEKL